MADTSTPVLKTKSVQESFDTHETYTWTSLPEHDKEVFFAVNFSSPTAEAQIKHLINEYNVINVNFNDIVFFHELEVDIEKKHEYTEEKEQEKEKHEHTKHTAHVSHSEDFKPSFHEVYMENSDYQKLHKQVTQTETTKFQNSYQKKYKKLPTQEEVDEYLNRIAEEKFKADPKHKRTAHDLEQKEILQTKAEDSSHDTLLKQYQQHATSEARKEISAKKLKAKLAAGTISNEAYRNAAIEIYTKHHEEADLKAAKELPDKVRYYATVKKEARYQNAITTIRLGRVRKQREQTKKNFPSYTSAEAAALTTLKHNPSQLTPKQKELLARLKNRSDVHPEIKAEIAKMEKATQKASQQLNVVATKEREEEVPDRHNNSNTSIRDIYKQIRKLLDRENTFENFEGSEEFPEQIQTENLGNGVERGDFSDLDFSPNTIDSIAPEATVSEAAATEATAATTTAVTTTAATEMAAAAATTTAVTTTTEVAVAGGPVTLIVIVVILIILLIVMLVVIFSKPQNTTTTTPIPGFTMTVDGPDSVPNGITTPLNYTINITDTLPDTIQITNPIPAGAVCAPGTGYTCNGNNDIVWNLDTVTPTQTNGNSKIYKIPVSFTVASSTKDVNIVEEVTADDQTTNNGNNPVPGLTLTVKTNPATAANGQTFGYVIDATYTGNDPSVQIFANVPAHTQLVGQPTGPKVTNTNGLISWLLSDYGKKAEFTYSVKPDSTLNDTVLSNTVYATAKGAGTTSNVTWLNSYASVEFAPHFDAWVWAQCSQASMAEIFNVYSPLNADGSPKYKIVDLETWAQANGIWDPSLGLLGPQQTHISQEADHFGFKVDSYTQYPITDQSLDTLIGIAKGGKPIMVSAPNHWLVLWGADPDNQHLWLLDSSNNDFTWAPNTYPKGAAKTFKMPRDAFLHGGINNTNLSKQYWTGIGVVISPK